MGYSKYRKHAGHHHRRGRRAATAACIIISLCGALVLLIGGVASSWNSFISTAAELSAKLSLPRGGAELLSRNIARLKPGSNSSQSAGPDGRSGASSAVSGTSSSSGSGGTPASPSIPAGMDPVKTVAMTASGVGYETYQNISVFNETKNHKADIKNQLSIGTDLVIAKSTQPQVLIYHNHACQNYLSSDTGFYDPLDTMQSTDATINMCRIGDEIAFSLNSVGIKTIHDTTLLDYPDYTGAYNRGLTLVENYLKKYPSIKIVLDVHRDSIQYSDGTRIKPTVTINGRKAAQIMIVAPCDEGDTALPVPDWKYNYRFGLKVQQALERTYPGLARPLDLCPRRYNMQVSHGALLVNIGSDANTLDEAVYSGQLFGQVMANLLSSFTGAS